MQEKQNTELHFEGEGGAAPRAKPVSIHRIIKATKGIITQYVKGRVCMKFSVLVAPSRDYNNWPECFKALADLLEKEQRVKPGFWESVFAREQSFPTGLQITPTMGIAIPHPSDSTLVKESTVAVIMLPHPIEVCSMAEPEEKIMVSVVLMLALRGSEDHLIMLQHMMETFQDEELLNELLALQDPDAVKQFLEDKLGKE